MSVPINIMNDNNQSQSKSEKDDKKENMPYDINNEQYIETPWNIIESYFKGHHLERLVQHQIESYNNFVGYQIIKTIEMFNPIRVASEQDFDIKSGKYALELFITFDNFHIYRPQIHENNGATKLMFPQEARLRNFTYASAMTIDINKRMMEQHSAHLRQEASDRAIVRARKEVEINGGGTSGYTIKEGEHAGTVVGHIKRDTPTI